MDALQLVKEHKLVAIFRGVSGEKADLAADALVRGGIRIIETTMNTEGALSSIETWRTRYDGQASIGAGTVLDVAMAKEAVAAGAQFLISPNLDEEVVAFGLERGLDVFPGVMTPTEIVRAVKAGARAIKLFPMGSLGLQYLKEIRAPLSHVPMIVTGGVNLGNIKDFLASGAIGVGLGGNLVDKTLVNEGRYEELEALARAYVDAAKA